MEPVQTEEYRGYSIEIVHDENPEDPREWDNLGVMVCHKDRNYTFGDKEIPEYYLDTDKNGYEISYSIYSLETAKEWIKHEYGEIAIILPLQIYEHSGITMYIGDSHDRFDGRDAGYIFVTKKQLYEEYATKRITKNVLEKAEKLLRDEVEKYDNYLTGEVYGYDIRNKNDELVDGGYSYYGYPKGVNEAMSHAKHEVDFLFKEEQKKREMKLRGYIKNSVPFEYRTF